MNPPEGATPNPDRALIDEMNGRIDAALEGLIPRDRPYALLDFPHAPNVGDSLIWLGQLAWLERHGYPPPSYTCSNYTYSPERLRRKIGDGTIVLSGGGNFGDLYLPHQSLREAVIEDFPDLPVVQLPQTIRFDSGDALRAAAVKFKAHPRVVVLTRDRESLKIATDTLGVNARLSPDMAFCLGAMPWRMPVRAEALWMRRQDKESAKRIDDDPPAGVRTIEWLEDWRTPLLSLNLFMARQLRYRPRLRPWFQRALSATYAPVAHQRVDRGRRILGAGHFIITDRLHGHILAILMGIPHAVLDNVYGKVRRFHDCWTRTSKLAEWCDTEEEAIARARSYLAERRAAKA
jgi:pyruvyl transferase EpsO